MNTPPIASTSVLPSYAAAMRPLLMSQLAICLKKVSNVSAEMPPRDRDLVGKLKLDFSRLKSVNTLKDAAKLKKHAKELDRKSNNRDIRNLLLIASDIKTNLNSKSTKSLAFNSPSPTYEESQFLTAVDNCTVHLSAIRQTTNAVSSRNTVLCTKIESDLKKLNTCIVKNQKTPDLHHSARAGKHILDLTRHLYELVSLKRGVFENPHVENLRSEVVAIVEALKKNNFRLY